MFFRAPGQPTRLKKVIYLIGFIILGLLLSLIAHAILEMSYLQWLANHERIATFYGGCALRPSIQAALWLLGAGGGSFLGLFCWRKVYVERSWEKPSRG